MFSTSTKMAGSVECVNGCTTKTGKPSTHSLKNCPLEKKRSRFPDGTPLENTAPAGIFSCCASLITNADGVPPAVLANERTQTRSDPVPGLSVDTLGGYRVGNAVTRSESDTARAGRDGGKTRPG